MTDLEKLKQVVEHYKGGGTRQEGYQDLWAAANILLMVANIQSEALTEIANWRKPDSGYWETSIPDALAGTAETALDKAKEILEFHNAF